MTNREQIPTRPLYALVGAGDLLVERVRLRKLAIDTLPERVQSRAAEAVDSAGEVYDELVDRGNRLVTRIRGQESTQRFEAQAANTVNQAKGAATSTKRSATTAKRTAATAKTRGTAAARAAKRTAEQAATAAADAADKVGD